MSDSRFSRVVRSESSRRDLAILIVGLFLLSSMKYVGSRGSATTSPWGPVSGWTITRNGSNPVTSIPAGETTEQYVPAPIRLASGDIWIYVKGASSIYAWKSTDNGVTFSIQNSGNAVLTPGSGLAWDHTYVLEATMLYDASASTIHMYYKGYPGPSGNGISWGHATAPDSTPTVFTKDAGNPILAGQDVAVALGGLPVSDMAVSSVILIGSTWHFYGYINYGGTYYLCQTTGTTKTTPTASGMQLITRWTSDAVFETPSVLREPDGSYLMLYTRGAVQPGARSIYTAISSDGVTWTSQSGTVLAPTGSGWEQLEAYSGQFIRSNSSPFSDPYIDGSNRSLFYYSGLDNGTPNLAKAGLAYITLV